MTKKKTCPYLCALTDMVCFFTRLELGEGNYGGSGNCNHADGAGHGAVFYLGIEAEYTWVGFKFGACRWNLEGGSGSSSAIAGSVRALYVVGAVLDHVLTGLGWHGGVAAHGLGTILNKYWGTCASGISSGVVQGDLVLRSRAT